MEYGFAPTAGAVDSSLARSKANRQERFKEESQKVARYKSSLNKVFNDETLSPVKGKQTKHLNLGGEDDPKNNLPRAFESLDAHNVLNHMRPPQVTSFDDRRGS